MPVDRTTAYGPDLELDIADRLLEIYSNTERQLAADIARRLRAGMEAPTWAERKLAEVGALRRAVQALMARLAVDDGTIAQALVLAYMRGGDAAAAEVLRLGRQVPAAAAAETEALQRVLDASGAGVQRALASAVRAFPGLGALQRMVRSLASRLSGTHLPVLRWAIDSYRDVVAEGALAPVLLGTATRRAGTQRAWERLLQQGVTGFTDAANRRWNLASYVEMATRTGVAQAAVEGHLDRLSAAKIDLVIVSNAPQECARCRPWEGKVLARGGAPGTRTMPMRHAITGETVQVEVAGNVAEAIAAGLMHPNCRHSLSAYLPGVTRIPTNTEDPEGDAARQKLRALERQVRKDKLVEAGALTPDAKRAAGVKVRADQAAIREHVAATRDLGIMRKPERERIDLGHTTAASAGQPARTPTAAKPKAPPAVPKAARPYHGSIAGLEDVASAVRKVNQNTLRRKLSGGLSAKTELVELPDGRHLVHKTGLDWSDDPAEVAESVRHQADAEQLASLLGRAIDAPVARVYRTQRDSVWMEYIDDATDGRPSDLLDTPEGIRLGLLDVLSANTDRNSGNLLIRDGSLVGIDHGWSWGASEVAELAQAVVSWPDRPVKHFVGSLRAFGPNPLHPDDVDVLLARLRALRPDFDRLGRGDWLDYSLAMLERMRSYATGTERLYG